MKVIFTIILTTLVLRSSAQSFVLGTDASITIGENTSFFMGGDATLDGTFNNSGTILSYGDLDLQDNTTMESIKFVGADDQQLSANDTLIVNVLSLDKQSELNMGDGVFAVVEGSLEIVSGVLGAGSDTTLLVSGEISGGSDDGFIEGKIVALTQSEEINFPMGVNGAYNALMLSNLKIGETIIVESRFADQVKLRPTEDMIGIADEIEWVVTTNSEDSIEVTASAIFNGIDLSFEGLSSFDQYVRADEYTPVLVKYSSSDTLYVDLGVADLTDTDLETFGTVKSEKSFYISKEPTLLSIALIPVLLEPSLYVPNAFSPNSSMRENKIFRPYFAGATVTNLRFSIIDSFQNNLYSYDESSTDESGVDLSLMGWDGWLPNGQIADGGVYYYSVELEAGGQSYSDFGSFLLAN